MPEVGEFTKLFDSMWIIKGKRESADKCGGCSRYLWGFSGLTGDSGHYCKYCKQGTGTYREALKRYPTAARELDWRPFVSEAMEYDASNRDGWYERGSIRERK